MKSNDERFADIISRLEQIPHIRLEQIPEIDLYMDQVLSFMEDHLKETRRSPDDKVLTKTMINNYAKNNLLPPPVKKKYSREHMVMLLFIYYYKSLLSFHDIGQLLGPICDHHFQSGDGHDMGGIYEEICSLKDRQLCRLKDDVKAKFDDSRNTFTDFPDEEREYLQLFSFISELSFVIYIKNQMIAGLIDQLRAEDLTERGSKKNTGPGK
ncbi:MAG: DUF1836 domain-containing protein [Clostridiales bacterium]|nr:DUF1836 domain-containing protein [Clostridiales bacterium]